MIHRFGDLEIDTSARTVLNAGRAVALQPRPFDLLALLLENRGRTVSKEEMIEVVWDGRAVSDSALSTAVRDIRRAISDAEDVVSIRTHYGRGLSLETSDEPEQQVRATVSLDAPPWAAPVIAVLPFDNLTPGPDGGYLADGLAEDIITKLSRFRDVSVLARNSSFSLRGQSLLTKEIGERLGAGYLIEGSVRRVGPDMRLTVQLVEAPRGTHLWADHFEVRDQATGDVQDSITSGIAASSAAIIGGYEVKSASDKTLAELNAWEAYIRGYHVVISRNRDRQGDAIGLLERSIELDPNAALPHAVLSYAINVKHQSPNAAQSAESSVDRRTDERLQALALARRAIELDPLAAFAWIALARCLFGLGDVSEAVAAADKGLAINPDHAWGHYIRGMALWQINRAEDAVAAFDAALASTPHEEIRGGIMAGRACALVLLNQYDEANEWSRKAQLEPHAGRLAYLGEIVSLGLTGRRDEAVDAIERAKSSDALFNFANVFHDLPLTDAKARQKIMDGLIGAGMV